MISSENKLNVFYSIIIPCPKCRIHMDTVHCNSYNVCERRPILRVKCPAFFHYCPMTVNKEIIIIYIGLFYFKILKEFVFIYLRFWAKFWHIHSIPAFHFHWNDFRINPCMWVLSYKEIIAEAFLIFSLYINS